jgi:photosystem II stability/assembly factor-like uncharacterized protein
VGEQGLVLRLEGEQFVALETPYKGTYFGVTGKDGAVVVFGLRGHAFRSSDAGKTWTRIDTGLQDGLTGGTAAGERVVLVSQSGNVLVSNDAGQSFAPVRIDQAAPASAVLSLGPDALVIAGPRGVRTQTLQ